MKKIKVLIIDDSFVFRQTFSKHLSEDHELEVIATAADAYEARDMIIKHRPDVMTLDVEMPKMNGIDFLKRLMPQYPLPTVVVSALSENVFEALNAGAVDFVSKPQTGTDLDVYFEELIEKIKIASRANIAKSLKLKKENTIKSSSNANMNQLIIGIGASTGGTNALFDILTSLPKEMPPIVIVQHMPPGFTKIYSERLDKNCQLKVVEGSDGEKLEPGKVIIAPGGYHMSVIKKGSIYSITLEKGTEHNKVNGHCPSVDILFDSLSKTIKGNGIGVILTGMGRDGAQGLLKMRNQGARTIGQDEQSSVVYGMPKVANDVGAVEKQYTLTKIAEEITHLIKTK